MKSFHRVSCCGFEIMNTSANDENPVPGDSSAAHSVSQKEGRIFKKNSF